MMCEQLLFLIGCCDIRIEDVFSVCLVYALTKLSTRELFADIIQHFLWHHITSFIRH